MAVTESCTAVCRAINTQEVLLVLMQNLVLSSAVPAGLERLTVAQDLTPA